MKSLILKLYAFKFFSDFMLIYPLYAVMFVDHGLSTGQIASILMVWSAVVVVLEVPSGALADRLSRRKLLAGAQMIRVFGFLSWLLFPNYWGFFAGFVLWGIRSALTSGTLEALVYDELKLHGEEASYGRIAGRSVTVSFIAILCASAGAALAAPLGYEFVLVCSIIAVVISAILPLTFPEAPPSQVKESQTPYRDYINTLKEGIKVVGSRRSVLLIVIFTAFATGSLGMLDEFWPIYVNLAGGSNSGVAIFMGVMSACQGVTSYYAHNFEKVGERVFYGAVAVVGLILVVAGYLLSLWALILIILIASFDPTVRIVFGAKLQHEIPSETRATATSVMGFATEITAIMSAGLFGLIASFASTQMSFILMGVLIALIALGFLGAGASSKVLVSDSRPGE